MQSQDTVMLLHAGLRLGMYSPMKTAMGADTDPTVLKKVAAGSASGAIATFITNPIELLKTRLQSCSTMGPLQVIKKIVKQDGVTGLWKGTMPSAVSTHVVLCQFRWHVHGACYVRQASCIVMVLRAHSHAFVPIWTLFSGGHPDFIVRPTRHEKYAQLGFPSPQ